MYSLCTSKIFFHQKAFPLFIYYTSLRLQSQSSSTFVNKPLYNNLRSMCKSICLEQQPVKNDISIVILIFNSTILYYSFKILSARSIPVNFAFSHWKKVQNRILLKHEILPKILQRLLAVPKSMQHTKSELLHISSHMDSSVLLFTLYR